MTGPGTKTSGSGDPAPRPPTREDRQILHLTSYIPFVLTQAVRVVIGVCVGVGGGGGDQEGRGKSLPPTREERQILHLTSYIPFVLTQAVRVVIGVCVFVGGGGTRKGEVRCKM